MCISDRLGTQAIKGRDYIEASFVIPPSTNIAYSSRFPCVCNVLYAQLDRASLRYVFDA